MESRRLLSVMVRRSAHRFPELPDPGSPRCDPVPEGARLLEFPEERRTAPEAVDLLGRLGTVVRHRRTPWGARQGSFQCTSESDSERAFPRRIADGTVPAYADPRRGPPARRPQAHRT